ncbi:MAG TPA: flavodoxin [Papillibacter sp.]|nr:flavodoxin [Papillibacter sp.]
MKTAVIYKSRYGSTEMYAKWIAEELGADSLPAGDVSPEDLEKYEVIVYGGGLYAGSVNGSALLTKNLERIKDKKLYLFTVGLYDVSLPENVEAIRSGLEKVLPPALYEKLRLYHFRGGMHLSKMGFLHRFVMKMMANMLRKKPESELSDDDRLMLQNFGQDIDFTDRSAIAPLVKAVMAGLPPQ